MKRIRLGIFVILAVVGPLAVGTAGAAEEHMPPVEWVDYKINPSCEPGNLCISGVVQTNFAPEPEPGKRSLIIIAPGIKAFHSLWGNERYKGFWGPGWSSWGLKTIDSPSTLWKIPNPIAGQAYPFEVKIKLDPNDFTWINRGLYVSLTALDGGIGGRPPINRPGFVFWGQWEDSWTPTWEPERRLILHRLTPVTYDE
jgi:hypothetical protein